MSVSLALFIKRSARHIRTLLPLCKYLPFQGALLCFAREAIPPLGHSFHTRELVRASYEHRRKTGPSIQPWRPVRSHQKPGWPQACSPGHFSHFTLLPQGGLFPIFVNQPHSFLSNRKAPDATGRLQLNDVHEGEAGSGAGPWHLSVSTFSRSSWAWATSASLQCVGMAMQRGLPHGGWWKA